MSDWMGPGSFDHDVARRRPSVLREWIFSRPNDTEGRRSVFWTQIALVIAGPALMIGFVVVLIMATASRPIVELSGTESGTSTVFLQAQSGAVEVCISGRLIEPDATIAETLAKAELYAHSSGVIRSSSVLATPAGVTRCSGHAEIEAGFYHLQVTSSEMVRWEAWVR